MAARKLAVALLCWAEHRSSWSTIANNTRLNSIAIPAESLDEAVAWYGILEFNVPLDTV